MLNNTGNKNRDKTWAKQSGRNKEDDEDNTGATKAGTRLGGDEADKRQKQKKKTGTQKTTIFLSSCMFLFLFLFLFIFFISNVSVFPLPILNNE